MSVIAPILLITFNRPNHTRQVLERIVSQNPEELYIFQDGARPNNEKDTENCQSVRQVINQLTASLNVKKYFSNNNLGCGPGPVSAINWFFENVSYGIIIEDDCLLSNSAFSFYSELLEKYKNDDRVFSITAANLHLRWKSRKYSYLFSTVGAGTLGCWATWRRAWAYFDFKISMWDTREGKEIIHENIGRDEYYYYYSGIFNLSKQESSHIWDYQWFCCKTFYNKLSIVSSKNMVSNIGFDYMGTHHTMGNSRLANMPIYEVGPILIDPPYKRERLFDWVVFQRYYFPSKKSYTKRLILKIIDAFFRK